MLSTRQSESATSAQLHASVSSAARAGAAFAATPATTWGSSAGQRGAQIAQRAGSQERFALRLIQRRNARRSTPRPRRLRSLTRAPLPAPAPLVIVHVIPLVPGDHAASLSAGSGERSSTPPTESGCAGVTCWSGSPRVLVA